MNRAVRIGRVTAFDESGGLGTIEADGVPYLFHCVEIADGSRTIRVGADVAFTALDKLGSSEAGGIVTLHAG